MVVLPYEGLEGHHFQIVGGMDQDLGTGLVAEEKKHMV